MTGTPFAILGAVRGPCARAGNPKNVIDALVAEASSCDCDHLLQTAMLYSGMLD
jgi:hypothetical protein